MDRFVPRDDAKRRRYVKVQGAVAEPRRGDRMLCRLWSEA